jgi:hypothetical protein
MRIVGQFWADMSLQVLIELTRGVTDASRDVNTLFEDIFAAYLFRVATHMQTPANAALYGARKKR